MKTELISYAAYQKRRASGEKLKVLAEYQDEKTVLVESYKPWKCWNCGKKVTQRTRKKHYPIVSGLFCKE